MPKEPYNLAGWQNLIASDLAPIAGMDEDKRITLSDLKITDERGQLMSLTLNPVQRDLMRLMDLDPLDPSPDIAGKLYRLRILKARREGISTLILALLFLDAYNNPNRRIISVAHEGEATQSIFEIVKRFYDNLPADKKLTPKFSNRKELHWKENDSRIFCGTAGTDDLGSGSTLHAIHKSERAKWPGTAADIAALDASLDEACRLGSIIEETTAKGFNHFRTDWEAAVRGEDGYTPIFFPWFAHPDYRAPVPTDFALTDDEEQRKRTFGLTNEQLYWYRLKRRERKDLTPQEYPFTPEDAFLSTGNPYFDRTALIARQGELQGEAGEPLTGLRLNPTTQQSLFLLHRNSDKDTHLHVYETPVKDWWYIVFADPASGLTAGGDHDYCSADVVCVDSWEQVAHVHGRWEPKAFARLLADLGWWYNTALLGVHRLGYGGTVLNDLLHDIRYPEQRGNGGSGIYFFDPTQLTGKRREEAADVRQMGWPENAMTKPYMLAKLGEFVSDPDTPMLLRDRGTVSEMLTYVHLPSGKAGGEAGSHDDRVSSLAGAAALLSIKFERKKSRYVRDEDDEEPPTPPMMYGGRFNSR